MEHIFNVCVEGGPLAVFDTASEAMSYAKRHVYLNPSNYQIGVDTLNQGQIYSFSYGFSSVDIIPIKKRAIP